jgi:hypothetical protein
MRYTSLALAVVAFALVTSGCTEHDTPGAGIQAGQSATVPAPRPYDATTPYASSPAPAVPGATAPNANNPYATDPLDPDMNPRYMRERPH